MPDVLCSDELRDAASRRQSAILIPDAIATGLRAACLCVVMSGGETFLAGADFVYETVNAGVVDPRKEGEPGRCPARPADRRLECGRFQLKRLALEGHYMRTGGGRP
jgi:hypothetical protein